MLVGNAIAITMPYFVPIIKPTELKYIDCSCLNMNLLIGLQANHWLKIGLNIRGVVRKESARKR